MMYKTPSCFRVFLIDRFRDRAASLCVLNFVIKFFSPKTFIAKILTPFLVCFEKFLV